MARLNKWERQHLNNLLTIQRQVEEVYKSACQEAASIGVNLSGFDAQRLFTFKDYPVTKRRVETLLESLKVQLSAVIVNGIRSEWTLANNKNNELCKQVFGDNVGKLSQEAYNRYFSTNPEALDAFISRKRSGLRLSDRVWNYTNLFKEEIELGLDVGIRSGLSADEMSRQLRSFLKYPDKLFRRVRDEHGNLRLSKNAAAFHPGRGVYRSSYKNARRLAATECNIAYRTSDYLRWQDLDFVVGIKIEPSATNHEPDICDDLAGLYPKTFKWTGWHPHCRCHALTVLKSQDEVAEDNRRILQGGEPSSAESSASYVSDIPQNFKDWCKDNQERMERASSKPYFITDNQKAVNKILSAVTHKASSVITQPVRQASHALTEEEYNRLVNDKDDYFTRRIRSDYQEWAQSSTAEFNLSELEDELTPILENVGLTDVSLNVKCGYQGSTSIQIVDGDCKFDIQRYFSKDKDGNVWVEHRLFDIDESLQGKGLSKSVFRAFYRQYQNIGVRYIDVHANIDVGGYCWARYGFNAKSKNQAIGAIQWGQLTQAEEDTIGALIENFYKDKPDTAMFPMNKIASLPCGKKALLNSDWLGLIDLQDPNQRKVFEGYLGL